MRNQLYHVISGTSEDRFDTAETVEDAVRIARSVAVREGRVGEPVLVEHLGMVVRELVLRPDGSVSEEVTA